MDFRLYAQVLWRHKLLVVCGLVLAMALAELSVVRLSTNGTVKYRHAELWASTTRLALGSNQLGRLQVPPGSADLGVLASQYAIWATSDPVRRLILLDGPLRGKIVASPLTTSSGANQPFIDLTAISRSPSAALALADRGSTALQTYIHMQLRAGRVPPSDRVFLKQILRNPPVVYRPRSKTLPIVIFLAVMLAVVGLAFILENVSPRGRGVDELEPDRQDDSADHIEPRPVGVESQAAVRRRTA